MTEVYEKVCANTLFSHSVIHFSPSLAFASASAHFRRLFRTYFTVVVLVFVSYSGRPDVRRERRQGLGLKLL